MAIRFLSIGRNPIQVLLIRSDPVRSRFCKRPSFAEFISLVNVDKRKRTFSVGKLRDVRLADSLNVVLFKARYKNRVIRSNRKQIVYMGN